jgi:hypothetical protein
MTYRVAESGTTSDYVIESMFDSVARAVSESPVVMFNRRVDAATKLSEGLQTTQSFLMHSVLSHA